MRRVSFDLTGLPPTPEEILAFENDDSPEAYKRVVDRLLASEEFGKHMAISWLDAARYADSYGYQADLLSPTWPWRDWVVRAINQNLPYNQFLLWQIAGDLVPDAETDQILATAFNRLHRQTNEGGSVELEWRTEYAADRVHTFGTAMLGMTLECARCHDHKFDPVSQRDYYNLFAFFNNIDEWGMYHDSSRVPTPSLLLPTDDQQASIREMEDWLESRRGDWKRFAGSDEFVNRFDAWLENHSEIEIVASPVAYWSLDELNESKQLSNGVSGGKPATTSPANTLADGYRGKAMKLTGDDAAEFQVENNWLEPWRPYSISFWIQVPENTTNAVILHRQGGTDVGNFGTRVSIRDGRVRFEKVRFWPGNALAVESRDTLSANHWHHIVVTNDGSATAAGMHVYIDRENQGVILRNTLTKDPQYRPGKNPGFVVGEQFRRIGLRNGLIDEISVFDMPLSPVEVSAIRNDQKKISTGQFDRQVLVAHFLKSTEERVAWMKEEAGLVEALLKARVSIIETMVMQEREDQRPAYVLNRGEYDAPRTEDNLARRGTPKALPSMQEHMPRNRLGLARWLISDNHPLTARVAVNRIWQGFFGKGLVETPNDFGYQSEMPVYSELLDWLARDFVDNDWDVKRLCRQIVLSSTYRQTSRCGEELRKQDPENRWLARGPSGRLTAEMIRDMALFVSGLLNDQAGGPPVSPYQPVNIWRENNTMTPAYNQSVGTDLYRRSLYTVWKRTTPMPNMMTFDATSREVCTVQRAETNTPQQAMVLLNDVQFVEAARVLATRSIVDHPDADDGARIQWLFVRLAGRLADDRELAILKELLTGQRTEFASDPENATKLAGVGETPVPKEVPVAELAAVTVVTQAILSSDATIWKR